MERAFGRKFGFGYTYRNQKQRDTLKNVVMEGNILVLKPEENTLFPI